MPNVKDLREMLDISGVTTNSDASPSWLLFSSPYKRIGIFGSTCGENQAELDIVNVPYFQPLIEEVIDENLGHVYLEPNDRETWKKFESILHTTIREKINDNAKYHGTEATFGVHIEPTIEEIDQKKLTGYVSFCYRELRMVYPFEIAPGEGNRPVVTVTELTNQFPEKRT